MKKHRFLLLVIILISAVLRAGCTAILKVNVSQGQAVKSGDVLCVLEAMKMENEIMAPKDGTVTQVLVSKGSTVDTGAPLVVIG